jgi:hypothetical protein
MASVEHPTCYVNGWERQILVNSHDMPAWALGDPDPMCATIELPDSMPSVGTTLRIVRRDESPNPVRVRARKYLFLKGQAGVSEVMLTRQFEHLDVQCRTWALDAISRSEAGREGGERRTSSVVLSLTSRGVRTSGAFRSSVSSSNVLKHLALRAGERSCSHHGSIGFSEQKYLGMNWTCISGEAANNRLGTQGWTSV